MVPGRQVQGLSCHLAGPRVEAQHRPWVWNPPHPPLWVALGREPPFCTWWRPGPSLVGGSGDPAGTWAWPPPSPWVPQQPGAGGRKGSSQPGLLSGPARFSPFMVSLQASGSPARNHELVSGSGRNSWSVGSWASPGRLRPGAGEAAGSPFCPWKAPPHTCSSKARPLGPGEGGKTGAFGAGA